MTEELYERDFEAIEAAVMETPRGRWFLAEFGKRNRVAETRILLDAISRLEQGLSGHGAGNEVERLKAAFARVAEVIDGAKLEAGGPAKGPGVAAPRAADLLGRLARDADTATADIHAAAERVQETSWTLRERGADPELCAELDRGAAAIHTACAFGELTGQRARTLVGALCFVEKCVDTLAGAAGPIPERAEALSHASAVEAGAVRPDGLSPAPSQAGRMVSEAPHHPPAPTQASRPHPAALPMSEFKRPAADPAPGQRSFPRTLAEIDRLDIREKLRLFT